MVCSTKATSAEVHDSQVFEHLLDGEEEIVYADKAYDSAKNRSTLTDHGIKDGIMHKARRNKEQPDWEVRLNKLYGKTRCHVERVFAHFKRHMGYTRCIYKGWDHTTRHF